MSDDLAGEIHDAWREGIRLAKLEADAKRLRGDMIRALNGQKPIFYSVETVNSAIKKMREGTEQDV